MSNKKKLTKDRHMHALLAGSTDRALCSKKTTARVTDDPEAVTCDACGQAAAEALERLSEEVRHQRANAALADRQPAPWWVTGQVDGKDQAPKLGAP